MNKTTERQAQMFSLVEESHRSTLTRKEFCNEHSISVNCFYYWQKKYRQKTFRDQPGFIRVNTGKSNGSWLTTVQPIILTYPNGVSLQLSASTPQNIIGSLSIPSSK
jgi:hypothetical protein